MKKSVKSLVLITIAALIFNNSSAQLKLPAINGVTSDVKKVIEDHPNHFANLKGEIISQSTQTTDYACTFNANGAEETTITQYSSKKEVYSWQALMLTTENFDKAKQKFRSLFNQLNNISVKSGGLSYKFKGDYEQPDEKKKFSSVILSAGTESKLKIEISMQAYEPMDWKVKLIIYDKEREDVEKGSRTEE
ncbi:MAG: hypothetical protein HOP10_06535 [Chitinophagaceae bacterium]|nr:hypothetical protein [Chitinophagaceae bacterium]